MTSRDAEIESLKARVASIERDHLPALRKDLDLYRTPWPRKLLFLLNGWPMGRTVQPHEQAWRPWHRWRGRRDGR